MPSLGIRMNTPTSNPSTPQAKVAGVALCLTGEGRKAVPDLPALLSADSCGSAARLGHSDEPQQRPRSRRAGRGRSPGEGLAHPQGLKGVRCHLSLPAAWASPPMGVWAEGRGIPALEQSGTVFPSGMLTLKPIKGMFVGANTNFHCYPF